MTSDQEMRDLRAYADMAINGQTSADKYDGRSAVGRRAHLVTDALGRLDAVRELHAPLVYADAPGIYFCKECQDTASGGTYPCPTIQLLDRSES